MNRQFNIQRTPLPIESVFTQEDIACNIDEHGNRTPIHDNIHWNRYYFDYPPEWQTSETGEAIVGVRSISLIKQSRMFEFNIHIRKYLKTGFLARLKLEYPAKYGHLTTVQQLLDLPDDQQPTHEEIEAVVCKLGTKLVNQLTIPIILDVEQDDVIDDITNKIRDQIAKCINGLDDTSDKPKFVQVGDDDDVDGDDVVNILKGYPNEDVTINFEDEEPGCPIYIESYRNRYCVNGDGDDNYNEADDCFVDIMLTPLTSPNRTLQKKYFPETFRMKPQDQQVEYNEDDDMFDMDFVDVFNIGSEPIDDNPYTNYLYFRRSHKFINVWDRSPCEVHASFANQSNHSYLGKSDVVFTPIKYYKLNARDNRFWIEFYDICTKNPVKIPNHEGFIMEMQFMQNDKLLYI